MNATQLNDHLKSGGVVQVTTYTRSTVYTQKNAGWFTEKDGSLFVRQGRGMVRLSIGDRTLVGIRCGRFVN